MKKSLLFVALAAVALAGCNQSVPYQASYPQPQVVQQAPVVVQEQRSETGSMLMGGALGYLLGRSHSAPAPAPVYAGPGYGHTVVQKTVVNKTVIVQNNHPAPAAAPVAKPAVASRFGAPTTYASAYNSVKPAAPTRSSYASAYSSRSTSSFSSSRSFGGRR